MEAAPAQHQLLHPPHASSAIALVMILADRPLLAPVPVAPSATHVFVFGKFWPAVACARWHAVW